MMGIDGKAMYSPGQTPNTFAKFGMILWQIGRFASQASAFTPNFCFIIRGIAASDMIHFFSPQKSTFSHNRISTHFFSMKMVGLGQNALVSCIVDFDDIQLCLRQFCLMLNICKVMTIFFKVWPKKIRKPVITLQILIFKQNFLIQRLEIEYRRNR